MWMPQNDGYGCASSITLDFHERRLQTARAEQLGRHQSPPFQHGWRMVRVRAEHRSHVQP